MAGIRAGHIVTNADLTDAFGQIVVKTGNESMTSNTTLQNDDELFLTLAASTKYIVDGLIIYRGATTGDLKLTFTVPSGATGIWSAGGPNAATSPATDFDSTGNAYATTRAIAGNGAAADMTCHVRGYLDVSTTAGFLQLQWAQNTSDVTATQVRLGSWLKIQKIL